MPYVIKPLPSENVEFETKKILKKLASAHRYLAELKGIVSTIPNESILINTLAMQEAKASSEIENIITTHDELYKADLFSQHIKNPATKEVQSYSKALQKGYRLVKSNKIITNSHILEIHKTLEGNDAGYRKLAGTALKNDKTGETIYTPPQDYSAIAKLMDNLIEFINNDDLSDVDPLIKLAIIHHQFESIHPFYDGNGRTGRIINILYMVAKNLLDIPVLYLSRYVIENKSQYYKLLQESRDKGDWEEWIFFILDGIEDTSKQTIKTINSIRNLMMVYKHELRNKLPKIYSQDLLNNLFTHPYTKIDFVQEDLQVSRVTASRYLNLLVENEFLEKKKVNNSLYYINKGADT